MPDNKNCAPYLTQAWIFSDKEGMGERERMKGKDADALSTDHFHPTPSAIQIKIC